MSTKKFWSDLTRKAGVINADILLLGNSETGEAVYCLVSDLVSASGGVSSIAGETGEVTLQQIELDKVVKYTPQSLSSAEKLQARTNIGVVSGVEESFSYSSSYAGGTIVIPAGTKITTMDIFSVSGSSILSINDGTELFNGDIDGIVPRIFIGKKYENETALQIIISGTGIIAYNLNKLNL